MADLFRLVALNLEGHSLCYGYTQGGSEGQLLRQRRGGQNLPSTASLRRAGLRVTDVGPIRI